MPGFVSVIFAILLFSILIFVHELGHFLAAKAFGVQVNEFSMFMGPAIYKKQKGETLYSIRCIPIGGYCAMEGEDQDTENPRSFQKASWWKRLIILVAGAAMNFLIGIVFFTIVYIPTERVGTPVLTEFTECCTFHGEDGLQVGDEILQIDGERVYTASNISLLLSLNSTGTHDIVVLRDGEKLTFNDLPMAHTCVTEDGQEYTHYGIGMGGQEATFGRKLKAIWYTTLDNVRSVRLSLQMLLSGQVGLSDMAGPVGIVDMMSDAATTAPSFVDALLNLIYFGGFLAVNLGVMNLLPIPALDGGRAVALVLTTVIQKITKKKIDPKYEGYIHAAGMILLLGLMALIMFKDIFTIFKG
ncbi:MAG: site-2 protease family protein [Oscillospiraceae bacterium]|nr:site-2 protease family protein [Oscillospiraceae bacterium]